jgi:hypothetical protein
MHEVTIAPEQKIAKLINNKHRGTCETANSKTEWSLCEIYMTDLNKEQGNN